MTSALALAPTLEGEAWLAERRNGIGASDAAAVLGLSPYTTPRQVYLDKLGLLPQYEESEASYWGKALEPIIAQEYAKRTGNPVVAQQVFLRGHGDHHFLSATLDAVTEAGHAAEFKTISAFLGGEVGDEAEDLPDHWQIQGNQQMFLSETEFVDFAILIGGQRFVIRRLHRNEGLIKAMLPKLESFWNGVNLRMPPARKPRHDRKMLHLLYPEFDGEIDLAWGVVKLVDRYQALGPEIRDLESQRDELKEEILESLRGASIGHLPDGRVVTRKTTIMPERLQRSYERRDFRIKKGNS